MRIGEIVACLKAKRKDPEGRERKAGYVTGRKEKAVRGGNGIKGSSRMRRGQQHANTVDGTGRKDASREGRRRWQDGS